MSSLSFVITSISWTEGNNEEPQELILGIAYDNVNAESIFNDAVEEGLEEMGYHDGANIKFEKDDETQSATIIDVDKKYHCKYFINVL